MRKVTLPNGLVCVAREAPWFRMPAVSLWFPVGTSHGERELPQTAHLLEHLSMRGPEGEPGRFAAWLESEGALFNACVHREWTAFIGRVPEPVLATGLDALKRLTFAEVSWTGEHLQLERDIVRSELARHARDVSRRVSEEAKAVLLPDSPYAISLADHIACLDKVTLNHVLAFRKRHLTPANGILLLCGAGAERSLDTATEVFADVRGENVTPAVAPSGVRSGQRRGLLDQGGTFAAAVAFPGPSYLSEDREVMTMAHGLLAYGMGGRLYREAVLEQGLTYQVQTDMEYGRQQGVCVFFARMRDGEGIARFLDIVQNAATEVAAGRFSPAELRRARERYTTQLQLEDENPQQAVMRDGRHLIFTGGSFDLSGTIDRLRSLKPDDVAEIWSHYLAWPRASVVTVKGREPR